MRRPGTASHLAPIEGRAHEWRTSALVTSSLIWRRIGKTIAASVSKSLSIPEARVEVGSI